MKLVFASNNKHKIEEIRSLAGDCFELLTLKDAGIDIEIPEPHPTIEANATEKSKTIYRLTGLGCFSDDTGLEVEALGGAPGVKSARYAGENNDFDKNIKKLLTNLEGITNRKARFRSVISLILNGREHLFEGVCNGQIIRTPRGTRGFGYDPVFVPEGETRTFAEMSLEEKNQYNHRRKAFDKLITFLQTPETKDKN